MRLRDHYKDRVTKILGALVVLAILSGFLYIVGNTFATIFLMDGTVIGIWMIEDLIGWHRRKRYFKMIWERVEDIEQPWLIAELLPVSYRAEDRAYQGLLRLAGSSAIERIREIED